MKQLVIATLLILSPVLLVGQNSLSGIHGLVSDNGEQIFEIEGYVVSLREMEGSINKKTIDMAKEYYQLSKDLKVYKDSTIKVENRVMEALNKSSDLPIQTSQKCILLQKKPETITALYLETSVKRDLFIEEKILESCLKGNLSKYISTDKTPRFIYLANNRVDLPEGVVWTAPNKISRDDSRVFWSEFSSPTRANEYISNQIIIDKNEEMDFVGEDEMEVFFDGIKTKAIRSVYHDSLNTNTANYLIVYYLTCKIKERHIACVLSHYSYKNDDLYLPSLLKAILEVPNVHLSVSEKVKKNTNTKKIADTNVKEEFYQGYPLLIEYHIGAWIPISHLKKLYPVAPTFGSFVGYSINKRMGIDLGLLLGIPVNGNSFNYYEGSLITETETSYFFGASARWRNHKIISRDVSLFTYLGLGGNWLSTDIELSYNPETDVTNHASVGALDAFTGINIRYKKIGGFIEYHFTPYHMSNKVAKTFGHSSFYTGFSYIL